MEDELHVIYIVHGGSPQSCRRCYASTRPPCFSCGHALSGNIETGTNQTVCEFCHKAQDASGLTQRAPDRWKAPAKLIYSRPERFPFPSMSKRPPPAGNARRSAATMQTLDQLPTNTFSRAYKAGLSAALAKQPITVCRCRNVFAIADWRSGWRDAAEQSVQSDGACMHPKKKRIEGELFCWQCGVNVTPRR